MKETRFVAWPDTHVPYQDETAVACALKILQWYKPAVVIILGDFMDMLPVSHWLKGKRKSQEGLRLTDDYANGNSLLDKITKDISHLVYIEGNHDGTWIRDAVDSNPEFDGLINLDIGLKFAARRKAGLKITQKQYGECWNLGKLFFTHGTYTGASHARKHVEAYERSIVYGHLHDVQMHIKCSPIDVNDRHMGLCLGCLTEKNPQYMKNRPNNWSHALGVGTVRSNGLFNIDPIIISQGTATYAGKTFTA